ncbi:radical SAM/SPASM domain-containing protein [Nocardiopsis eucommiae]|uniref:Radical SAM/SPASM domain-containing protein n=1 Tax=Nocardiopsis eucommiae TaxID=2831970 RepID=A0A975LCX3_9ACTN|nr:radical SAM/SPASM domain-containing protein [Nocardiopsis eucommiae]
MATDLTPNGGRVTITPGAPIHPAPGFLWLDLTRRCQLECSHCYNESGPDGGHGIMTHHDWLRTIDQAADTGARHVQLIGGEPTLHPDAIRIAEHALARGLSVEVYSNLVHVTPAWWALLRRSGMSLATSYYGSNPVQHNLMTGRKASHRHTRANIVRALEANIPLRVAIITSDCTDVTQTRAELERLGVTHISIDRVRPYGRGARAQEPDCFGLCGACGDSRASVALNGEVSPCVFSTWMSVGNVLQEPLADILAGPGMAQARARITAGRKDDEDDGHVFVPCSPDDNGCSPGVPPSKCPPRN